MFERMKARLSPRPGDAKLSAETVAARLGIDPAVTPALPPEAPAAPVAPPAPTLSPLAAMAQKSPAPKALVWLASLLDTLLALLLPLLIFSLLTLLDPAAGGYVTELQTSAGNAEKERSLTVAALGVLNTASLALLASVGIGVVLQAAMLSGRGAATLGGRLTGLRMMTRDGLIPSTGKALLVALTRALGALGAVLGFWFVVQRLNQQAWLALAGGQLHRPMLEAAVADSLPPALACFAFWLVWKTVALIIVLKGKGLGERLAGLTPLSKAQMRVI